MLDFFTHLYYNVRMRRFGIILLSAMVVMFCLSLSACGPSMSFTGTFFKDSGNRTYTLTLKSDGTFRYVRKFKQSSGIDGDPVDNPNSNIRTGRYVVYTDKNEATFSYSYYDAASGQTLKGSALGKLSKKDGNVILTLTGEEMKGTFIKK